MKTYKPHNRRIWGSKRGKKTRRVFPSGEERIGDYFEKNRTTAVAAFNLGNQILK